MSNIYKVTGEVIYKNEAGEREIDDYEESFNVDDSHMEGSEPLSYIKKALLPKKLKEKFKGFKHIRTTEIISVTPTNEKPKESELDKLMKEALENKCVPTQINQYKSESGKIKALKKALKIKENSKNNKENSEV